VPPPRTREGVEIIANVVKSGLRVHAFRFKKNGLAALKKTLSAEEWTQLSADSMAWSRTARLENVCLEKHERPGPGRMTGHRRCTSCREFALRWREGLLGGLT